MCFYLAHFVSCDAPHKENQRVKRIRFCGSPRPRTLHGAPLRSLPSVCLWRVCVQPLLGLVTPGCCLVCICVGGAPLTGWKSPACVVVDAAERYF